MIEETEPVRCPDVDLLVVDKDHARLAMAVDDWNAISVIACVSEDPSKWSELIGVWPRYQTGPSADHLEDLDFKLVDFDAAMKRLSNERAWLVIDMRTKRICVGKANDPIERDGYYVSDELDEVSPDVRIAVHLPPWWELFCHVELSKVDRPRQEELRVFQPRREILWGSELTTALAELMLDRFVEDEELSDILSNLVREFSAPDATEAMDDETNTRLRELRNKLHARTVAVHRDWLMTPRNNLNGRMPRQCLHGGVDWLDRVIEGQKMQVSSAATLTPLPDAMAQNPDLPMGRSEVCLYFDLCRELIQAGWIHLSLRSGGDEINSEEFATYLAQVQHSWMRMPHEDGASPESIIEAERYRIPRVLDAEHAGVIDCDCPICEMMKNGNFGPTFEGIDGHHLELDGEFAFSLHETQEDWEENQREMEEMSGFMEDAWSEDDIEDDSKDDQQSEEEDDEFGSVWKNTYVGHGGIPGDTKGHIAISFLLADMIGSLKHLGSQDDIDELNQSFREYRGAGQYELGVAREQFQQVLEMVGQRHPELVSRSADLQHRLDELARRNLEIDSDDDMPF